MAKNKLRFHTVTGKAIEAVNKIIDDLGLAVFLPVKNGKRFIFLSSSLDSSLLSIHPVQHIQLFFAVHLSVFPALLAILHLSIFPSCSTSLFVPHATVLAQPTARLEPCFFCVSSVLGSLETS